MRPDCRGKVGHHRRQVSRIYIVIWINVIRENGVSYPISIAAGHSAISRSYSMWLG